MKTLLFFALVLTILKFTTATLFDCSKNQSPSVLDYDLLEKGDSCKSGLMCTSNCYELNYGKCDQKNMFGLNIQNTVEAQAYLIVCTRRRFDKMSKDGLKKGFFQVLKKYYIQKLDLNKMENSQFIEYFKTQIMDKTIHDFAVNTLRDYFALLQGMYHFCDKTTRIDLQKNLDLYLRGEAPMNIKDPKFSWLLQIIRSIFQAKVRIIKTRFTRASEATFMNAKQEITNIFKDIIVNKKYDDHCNCEGFSTFKRQFYDPYIAKLKKFNPKELTHDKVIEKLKSIYSSDYHKHDIENLYGYIYKETSNNSNTKTTPKKVLSEMIKQLDEIYLSKIPNSKQRIQQFCAQKKC